MNSKPFRCALCIAIALTAAVARAETRDEFWPELNGFIKLNERTRLFLLGAWTVAETTPTPAGDTRYLDSLYGVHVDYSLMPPFRHKLREENWERNRYLWLRAGYVYTRSNGDAETTDRFRENRIVLELNTRTAPLWGDLEFTGRARVDLRDRNDTESQRYRLRVGAERSFDVGGRAVVPYAQAETAYDTRYDTWNRQLYQAGAEVDLGPGWRIEGYLGRQNDSRSEPSRTNIFGLALKIYR